MQLRMKIRLGLCFSDIGKPQPAIDPSINVSMIISKVNTNRYREIQLEAKYVVIIHDAPLRDLASIDWL